MTYGGPSGDELSDIRAAILEEIEQQIQRDSNLTRLRCGTPVCEHLLELDAAGRISIDSIVWDGDTWRLDLSPA